MSTRDGRAAVAAAPTLASLASRLRVKTLTAEIFS